jgi:uncharacterized protein (TIGR02246 family)
LKEKYMKRAILTGAMVVWNLAPVLGAGADRQAADEAAIGKAVEAYTAAFNRGDAKALAALWSPEAVYLNPLSGEEAVGRGAIEKQFAGIFAKAKGAQLEAKTKAIRFVSPNVAVEEGTAKVIRPKEEPEASTYTAVYVKRDGQWLLDRVTEEDVPAVKPHYEQLKELEWMIGTWVDQDPESRIETTCQWTKNQNFMTRSFMVTVKDRVEMAGMQIVGWDPATKQIRSWVFDSDGGFGEGVWSRKGNRWYVRTTGISPDGQKSSAVNIFTYIDKDTFTWQSVDRVAGGDLLPNIDEVVVVRQTADAN